MAREFARTDRVAQEVHKEMARIIQNDFRDRTADSSMITVSEVTVSRDLAHAKIYVTIFPVGVDVESEEGLASIKASMSRLKDQKGFMRGLLAQRVKMRCTPELHFFLDQSLDNGLRVSRLVDQARALDQRKSDDGTDEQSSDTNDAP